MDFYFSSCLILLTLLIICICITAVQSRVFTTSYGQVGISYLSDKKFEGSFTSSSGLEITYSTEWDHDYEYTSLSSSVNGTILTSYYVDYPYRLVRAQNTWILHDLSSGYSLEAGFLSQLTEKQLFKVNRRKLSLASSRFISSAKARSVSSDNPDSTVQWDSLLAQEDVQLLPSFSFGLVELGYTGAHYPILQRLFQFSARIYPLANQPSEPVLMSSNAGVPTFSWCSSNDDCEDENDQPSEESLCLGMCGPECSCWCWVCGDCCYHEGCYEHDVCCRTKIYSFSCWIPFNFTCDSFSRNC